MIIAGCCIVMMQTIHTNGNHMSNIFKFSSFELVFDCSIKSYPDCDQHFPHVLF